MSVDRARDEAGSEGCARCPGSKEGGCRERTSAAVSLSAPPLVPVAALSDVEPSPALVTSTAVGAGPLTSGDLARACHTTVRTVRFYEEAGLVEPVTRSEGGHRVYEPAQVPRLSLIIDLREAGLSLQDIKDLFELKQTAKTSLEASERMTAVLHRRIDEMQAKIACLRKLRDELAQTAAMIRECGSCDGEEFPKQCGGCDVMEQPDLPRAMRLLWGEAERESEPQG
ncbi:MAG: MerR family transcriptional regulator [Deltaproteobacteria bacterium]|nr:MerR family transcriptional regulator [Deltaproteobacteria bacterium]